MSLQASGKTEVEGRFHDATPVERKTACAAAIELPRAEIKIADALLSRAAAQGAELVVLGAYGHSRFRELILGGVTRHFLSNSAVPLLLSH